MYVLSLLKNGKKKKRTSGLEPDGGALAMNKGEIFAHNNINSKNPLLSTFYVPHIVLVSLPILSPVISTSGYTIVIMPILQMNKLRLGLATICSQGNRIMRPLGGGKKARGWI